MGRERPRTVVLDAGALIAFERGDRRVVLLLEEILAGEEGIVVPAGVVAQTWRDGARQARLAALIGNRRTACEPLDRSAAKACGVLCGLSGTSDIVDASVVLAAGAFDSAVVVTGDASDLRRIDPAIAVVEI